MNVFFVVLNEMLTGIVPSQVMNPARSYAAAFPGVRVQVLFLEPARVAWGRRGRRRLRELRRLWPRGEVRLCPYVSRFGPRGFALILRAAVRWCGGRPGRTVLHCRGPETTLLAARAAGALRARVVFDARGAGDHEAALRLRHHAPNAPPEAVARAAEQAGNRDQEAARRADAVLAVTEALAKKLTVRAEADKPVGVVPCCVERPLFSAAARQAYRARLGLSPEEILLVHTSTEARWEAFDQVIALFRAVQDRRPARLLFLTTLPPAVVTASLPADDALRRRILVTRARPDEMAGYLAAADVGLLLRRPHETHRFASPIKFAEYLGAGLVPVVSEGIGNTADVIRGRRVGVVLPADADADVFPRAAEQLLAQSDSPETSRDRAAQACRDLFCWDRYHAVVARAYGIG
jgi:glycosyltransferase involved in cell wall biosynthesis